MQRNSRQYVVVLASMAVAGSAIIGACGKKKKSSSSSSDTSSLVYPLGLALSVYPQTNSTSLALDDDKEQSIKAKNEDAEKRVRGEADCFPRALAKAAPNDTQETCYEFDSEMILVKKDSDGSSMTGTSDGKSKITGSTEACMVSFTRGKVKQISSMVDRTLGMVQMMICHAKKTGSAGIPASDGESIDFKAVMEAASTAAGKDPSHMPVSEAKMTKDGTKYITEIEMKMPSQPGTAPGADDPKEKITLTHNPGADASTYTGQIIIRRDKDFGSQSGSKERILTINYERSGDSVKYKLLTASISTKISANAIVDGVLDLNVGTNASGQYIDPDTNAAFSNQNDAASGIMMIGYKMNPTTGSGDFAYWMNPGANYSEKPRGFVSNVTADTSTGLISGCASSGAFSQGSIRKSIKDSLTIAPDGSYHPFACENSCSLTSGYYVSSRGGVNIRMYVPSTSNATDADTWTKKQMTSGATGLVARQCFTQVADGVYAIDTSKTPDTAGYGLYAKSDTALPTPPDLGTIK
jgi:hypothetical protein